MYTVPSKKFLIPLFLLLAIDLSGILPFLYPPAQPAPNDDLTPIYSSAQSVHFAVIGDFGQNGQAEADVAALVKSWNPDFIITTGDNNYPNGSKLTIDKNIGQYYHEYIGAYSGSYGNGARQNRFFPALGNHDWHTTTCFLNPCRGAYFGYFALTGNERYYDFIWGPIHFFVLDSISREPDGTSSDSKQGLWLKDRLAASPSSWNVVIMHYPPYSSGEHGSNTGMQWPYKEWGGNAVLSGHDHTYERIIVNDFPYFVNGLGGDSQYKFNTPISGSQVRFNQDYGAMLVDVNSQTLTFKFITRMGKLIDEYTLQSRFLK